MEQLGTRRTYSVVEAAQLLGVSRSTAYALAASGELPGVIRVGRRVLVSRERLEGSIPEDSTLWEETDLSFRGSVSVEMDARLLTGGEVLVEAVARGVRKGVCRRCLAEVERPFERSFTFYYVPSSELDADDPEARRLPESGTDLDLGPDVREELILSLSEYPVCRDECKGLCPRCGTDLNVETCECETTERDPRWEALRSLRE